MAISTSDPLLPSTALGWLPMMGMVLGVQIGGHGLMAHAMRGLPASYASVTALARRVLAGVGARPLFGETMGQSQIVGAALVLGGAGARRPTPRRMSAHRDRPMGRSSAPDQETACSRSWRVNLIVPPTGLPNSIRPLFRGSSKAACSNRSAIRSRVPTGLLHAAPGLRYVCRINRHFWIYG